MRRNTGGRRMRKLNRRRRRLISSSDMADLTCIRVVIIGMMIRLVRTLESMRCKYRLSQGEYNCKEKAR